MNKKNEYIEAMNEIKASNSLKRKAIYRIKEKGRTRFPYKLANAIAFVLIIFCVIFITDDKKIEEMIIPESIQQENMKLPTVDNVENLLSILKENNKNNRYYDENESSNMASAEMSSDDKLKSDTNVQVKGVDEADIVKTDGQYIYYISGNKLVIVKSGNDMKIVSEIKYENTDKTYLRPIELYIDNNKLIMILSETKDNLYSVCGRLYPTNNVTKAIIYDITNKEKPQTYREFEIEGNYINSRMTNKTIYLITNKYVYTDEYDETKEDTLTQKYTDSSIGEEKNISLSDICYIQESPDSSYLNVIAFDTQTKREANITTILGAGNNVYMNNENIYVTKTDYSTHLDKDNVSNNIEPETMIYKFGVNKTNIDFIAKKKVQGTIINQFSMDEYKGNFRIATTQSNKQVNNLYIFDSKLNEIGKLENLAKEESIYSVRFIKEKAYIVTFKQIDPLFVIDLKEPTKPKVLGELKIPGYSTYMHPYDETHLIGFGQDTNTDRNGNVVITGLKMALFDITNPANPQELYSVKIGDNGTYSDVLYNHKSLLFLKDKNILAFPITITKDESANSRANLVFQGAIVYEIDLKNGFTEKGRVAHMNVKNGYKDYDYKQEIERIMYVNNDLYTLSPGTIKRTDMNTMKELNRIEIKVEEQFEYIE